MEIGTNSTQLDSMDSPTGWHLTGLNIDTVATTITVVDTPKTFGDKSIKIDYEFTRLSSAYSWLYLDTDIPVYGIPESIQLDIKTDGCNHKVYILASDNDNELFRATVRGFTNNTEFETLDMRTTSFLPLTSGDFYYPIRIKSIHIKLGTSAGIGEVNKGTIYFDNLRVQYPNYIGISSEEDTNVPSSFNLLQNYPNPFNAKTVIRYELQRASHVELNIYNTLGQRVGTIVDEHQPQGNYSVTYDAQNLSSGIYFYRLKAGTESLVCKMILLR